MTIPTLYEWAGGGEVVHRLLAAFYARVKADPLLAPVFAGMDSKHADYVADFIGEVLGGPKLYSAKHGGHPHMINLHLNRKLSEAQRRRWMALLQDSWTDSGLPTDPEFASAFIAYLEWGSRLAVINSQEGVPVETEAPMPAWGWGVPGGPYLPKVENEAPETGSKE